MTTLISSGNNGTYAVVYVCCRLLDADDVLERCQILVGWDASILASPLLTLGQVALKIVQESWGGLADRL